MEMRLFLYAFCRQVLDKHSELHKIEPNDFKALTIYMLRSCQQAFTTHVHIEYFTREENVTVNYKYQMR